MGYRNTWVSARAAARWLRDVFRATAAEITSTLELTLDDNNSGGINLLHPSDCGVRRGECAVTTDNTIRRDRGINAGAVVILQRQPEDNEPADVIPAAVARSSYLKDRAAALIVALAKLRGLVNIRIPEVSRYIPVFFFTRWVSYCTGINKMNIPSGKFQMCFFSTTRRMQRQSSAVGGTSGRYRAETMIFVVCALLVSRAKLAQKLAPGCVLSSSV